MGARLAAGDVLLVGHHLEPDFDRIASAARTAGAAAVLLPSLGFDAAGAKVALDIARASVARGEPDHETPEHDREPENIHG